MKQNVFHQSSIYWDKLDTYPDGCKKCEANHDQHQDCSYYSCRSKHFLELIQGSHEETCAVKYNENEYKKISQGSFKLQNREYQWWYLAIDVRFPNVQKIANTAIPLCKNNATLPSSDSKTPMTKQMMKPLILVDQLNVAASKTCNRDTLNWWKVTRQGEDDKVIKHQGHNISKIYIPD